MDWSHFGIARRPFRPTVDNASYFPAAGYEAALAAIAAAHTRRDPVALLDGAPGAGKSLLARLWLERLPESTPRVLLANLQSPRPADLLQAILFDLNLPYLGLGEQELRLAVTEHLLQQAAANATTVLVVDEAQNLGPAAIEELRLLGNIESPDGSALLVLLAAQPRLEHTLKQHDCAGFVQRIGTKSRLEPFTIDESVAYLAHQMKVGGRDLYEVFDGEAVTLLAGACQGIPRLLNRAATCAAELAVQGEAERIDVEAAMEAVSRLGLDAGEAPADPIVLPHPGKPRKKTVRRKSA